MRWSNRRGSGNIEDRRGISGGRAIAGGGGIVGIIALVIYVLMGGNPGAVINQGGSRLSPGTPRQPTAAEDELARFVSVVLADTEDVWHAVFAANGRTYREPKLVLFADGVESACGYASAAVGPFYCPGDEKVYIDLSFFSEMAAKLGAKGDFAIAYVVAHEVGHHVQKVVGYTKRVDDQRGRISEAEQNRMSVRLELQADYLAGVWAHHAQKMKQMLEVGDIEEAMGAAEAVGDDRLQKRAKGYVVPDSFTHGTSAQRAKWFKLGFQTGDFTGAEQLFTLPYERL
jgi:predicted metalloprotease